MSQVIDTKEYMSAQIKVSGGGSGVVVAGARVDLHLSADEARQFAEGLVTAANDTDRVKEAERTPAKEEKKADEKEDNG